MLKGGASQESIFQTVKIHMEKGMTVQEAITEIESILRCKLTEHIVNLIYQECG